MALRKYDKEWLQELCSGSCSFAEVLRKAGRKQSGGAQSTLKKKIEEYHIDISHFTGQLWSKGKTKETDPRIKSNEKYSLEEILVKDSTITQKVLRDYIKRNNVIPYCCELCGCNGTWQNGIIALELHHKDGDNSNNEVSNLSYLCPNCHALTSNFRGKNKVASKNKNISDEEFLNALHSYSSIRQALIALGLAPAGANYERAKKLLAQE